MSGLWICRTCGRPQSALATERCEDCSAARTSKKCNEPNCVDGYVPSQPDGEPEPCPRCHRVSKTEKLIRDLIHAAWEDGYGEVPDFEDELAFGEKLKNAERALLNHVLPVETSKPHGPKCIICGRLESEHTISTYKGQPFVEHPSMEAAVKANEYDGRVAAKAEEPCAGGDIASKGVRVLPRCPSEKTDQDMLVTAERMVQGYVPFQRTTVAALIEMVRRLQGKLDKFRGLPEHWIGLDGEDGEPYDPAYMRRPAREALAILPQERHALWVASEHGHIDVTARKLLRQLYARSAQKTSAYHPARPETHCDHGDDPAMCATCSPVPRSCSDPNCSDGYVPAPPDGEPVPCPRCQSGSVPVSESEP
jgi:hypothetical protein